MVKSCQLHGDRLGELRPSPVFQVVSKFIALEYLSRPPNGPRKRVQTRQLRQSGLIPPSGQGTGDSVKRFISIDGKIKTIKPYREIPVFDLKSAKEAAEIITLKPQSGI